MYEEGGGEGFDKNYVLRGDSQGQINILFIEGGDIVNLCGWLNRI